MRDIQPLVVRHARVQHDELAVRPRSPLRPKIIQVRIVDDRGYLPGRHVAGVQPLFPHVIRSDHVVGKRRGHPINPHQRLEHKRLFRNAEFAGVKFRHHVMNIEDDLCPGQFGQPRGENEEVGNVVDVDQIVAILEMIACQSDGRAHPEF